MMHEKARKFFFDMLIIYMPFLFMALVIFSVMFSVSAFAEKIVYSNSFPVWYEYDCTDSSPSSWSAADPEANMWKYFSFYDANGNCYATLHTFDFTDISAIENVTSITYYVDSKSMVLSDPEITDTNNISCDLLYFGNVNSGSDISKTPDVINSIACSGTDGTVQSFEIQYTPSQNSTLTNEIQAGNFSQSFMVFPNLNATMRSYLDSNGYTFALGKFANRIGIIGDGFNCVTIEASNWCNLFDEPWEAVKKALGEDYIGNWFYVFVFMPLPFSVFLFTRNGAYAGFVCLPIMLFINTIEKEVFDISLALIAIAAGFGFYELLRKKMVE